MKYLLMAMILFSGFANYADDALVIFDGKDHIDGKSWAHPRGMSKMKVSYQHPYSNDAHLSFKAQIKDGWAGAGWNWCSWEGTGTDTTAYKYLEFRIGVSKDKIQSLFIQLTSNDGTGQETKGPKLMILPLIESRGKYIKLKIPLEKLTGDKLDAKNVWGIDFGVHGDDETGECTIYIDQIEFTGE